MGGVLLNREFRLPDDGWFQIAPLGEFAHAEASVVQVVDEAACRAMAAASEADSRNANSAGLLVDSGQHPPARKVTLGPCHHPGEISGRAGPRPLPGGAEGDEAGLNFFVIGQPTRSEFVGLQDRATESTPGEWE